MKTIVIDDKKYNIEWNAFTYIKYKQLFGVSIFDDAQTLEMVLVKQKIGTDTIKNENPNISEEELNARLTSILMTDIDDFFVSATRMAYAFIYSADENTIEYEEWLKSIKKMSIDDDWIVEVTELAVNCFC